VVLSLSHLSDCDLDLPGKSAEKNMQVPLCFSISHLLDMQPLHAQHLEGKRLFSIETLNGGREAPSIAPRGNLQIYKENDVSMRIMGKVYDDILLSPLV
jgi:hypothetical protein